MQLYNQVTDTLAPNPNVSEVKGLPGSDFSKSLPAERVPVITSPITCPAHLRNVVTETGSDWIRCLSGGHKKPELLSVCSLRVELEVGIMERFRKRN